jgi:TRAP-type transport system periplasmic protein
MPEDGRFRIATAAEQRMARRRLLTWAATSIGWVAGSALAAACARADTTRPAASAMSTPDLVAVAGRSVAATAPAAYAGDDQAPLVVKAVTDLPLEADETAGLRKFAELLERRTAGSVQLSVYPASELGTAEQMLEAFRLGNLGVLVSRATGSAGSAPTIYDLTGLPYLFEDPEHVERVVNGPIGQAWAARHLATTGNRVFGYICRLPRQAVFGGREVRQPADVRGLRLRAPTEAILDETWRAFGALRIPVAAGLPPSGRRGLVDGEDVTPGEIWRDRLWEAYDRLVLTGHAADLVWGQIPEQLWQRLRPARQQLWAATWREAMTEVEAGNAGRLRGLAETWTSRGGQVVEPDLEPWKLACASVWRKFAPGTWGPGVYEQVRAA